ncbi:MAG: PLP-dependent aminotransferase family protein [Rhodothermales bacterium]
MLSQSDEDFLYEQLASSITKLIDVGTLKPGDRLPSVRKLSKQRGVSIATVLQAYRHLEDGRLVEARPQSGFYVRPQVRNRPTEPNISAPPLAPTEVGVSDLVMDVFETAADPNIVPLGAAIPSPDLLPTIKLNRVLAAVARKAGRETNTYLLPQGYEPLRREIARRALDWGCTLSRDDILITCGCLQALSLSLRAVARAGDTVAVESPAYFGVLQLIESLHMKTLEIPTCPRDGIDVDALQHALVRKPVKACLVTPNFHNPLGSLMPEANKKALVDLLARQGIPLIEDDLYGDLYFDPPRPKSLKAYDRTENVIQCGSFSKTLAPGYRIGWVVPGRFATEVTRTKLASTISTAAPLQIAVTEFLKKGGYDHHLRGLRRAFAGNLERMTQAIGEFFPEGTRVTRPRGGFVLWVELPERARALDLHRKARKHKISIAPGPIFSATGQYEHFFRLNGGYPWSDRMEEALETLGRIARRLV